MFEYNTVEEAVKDLQDGKLILVSDDERREGDHLEGLRVIKTYEDGKLGLSTRAEKGEE